MDTLSQQYIALAFGIERHIPGFVDAYFGPEELRNEALKAAPPLPDTLLEQAQRLTLDVAASNYPLRRKAYLAAQVRALMSVCQRLAGEPMSYAEEVRSCFDVVPVPVDEQRFEDAIADLDELLPGTGSVPERLHAWRQRSLVTPEVARRLIDTIAAEARRRTAALLELPPDERVGFELVSDKPWSGYNWYLGGYRSLVEVNTDLSIYASNLTALICHESYPGHHTEHAVKEQLFYHQRGYGEQAIQLIAAPECVVSEGIAMLADSVIFPGDELARWQAEVLYPLAAIATDPETEARIAEATLSLRAVNANAALLLHAEGANEAEVVAYIRRYALRNEQEARHNLRFIADPLWRAYVFTYHTGRDLLGRWIAMGDRAARFRSLLTEQVYPALVEEWIIQERTSESNAPAA